MPSHTETMWSIEFVLHIYSKDEILVVPPWKRSWTWGSAHGLTLMQGLIETIFANRSINEINVVYDDKSGKYILNDGRHRVETLERFANNLFPIEIGGNKVYYNDLNHETARAFLNYKIDVTVENYSLAHNKKEILIGI